eukprot:15959_4
MHSHCRALFRAFTRFPELCLELSADDHRSGYSQWGPADSCPECTVCAAAEMHNAESPCHLCAHAASRARPALCAYGFSLRPKRCTPCDCRRGGRFQGAGRLQGRPVPGANRGSDRGRDPATSQVEESQAE